MMETTTRYALLVEDKVNPRQKVWWTKDAQPTAYGPGSPGVWYDGWRLAAFGSRKKVIASAVKLRGGGASVRVERWTYRGHVKVRQEAVGLDRP